MPATINTINQHSHLTSFQDDKHSQHLQPQRERN
uniref:Uncharacterized protein n=1 Tax=Rhizophora mucronata TaxID=61149 RepID=A0A2P2N8F9_RHIMU